MGFVPQVLALAITFLRFGGCVDPIVEITEPIAYGGVKILQARKGKELDMICVIQNRPTDTFVMWLQQSKRGLLKVLTTDTTSEEPQKYGVFNPTSISWRLRIRNVEENDEGLYLCRVETQPKTYVWDIRYVNVVEPPQIDSLQTSSDVLVEEGKELSLHCNASGRPYPAIIWTRLANADLPDGGKELRKSHLYKAHSRPEHRGKYLCRAENVAGEDIRIINVLVSFSPRVMSEEKIVAQAIGYRKELFCEIEAFPEPGPEDVTWTGPLVTTTNSNYEITYTQGANHRITVKLTIFKVGFDDYGDYICAASNALGNGQYTIRLTQSDRPVADRTGTVSGSTNLCHNGVVSLLMILSVWLLGGR